uniref:Cytochrome P450 n=1 Tax=Oryza glaberrima TaxID=4538 RepID=I1NLI3_ORYGL
MAERLLYGGRDVAFAPYGEYWRQARRICVVHLLSARRVLSFRRVREEEAAALVARVRAAAGGAVDLVEHLTAYSNTVVSRAVFGDESARGLYGDVDRGRALRKLFDDFVELLGQEPMGELLPWLGWVDAVRGLDGKVQRTFEALDSILEKVIDDHRHRRREVGRQMDDDSGGGGGGGHRDFVDVLLDVNETDKDDAGVHLGTIEIKDMFAAGTVTTTTAMEWAMAELITHREAMRKAQDEIREVVGVTGRVTEDHMDRLPYLKAMLKETLRLHPPNPLLVPHVPLADVEILDCTVPAHTRVFINAWTIGRDPTTWGEHAEKFMPERFLNNNLDYKGQDFELIPFGAGRRGCPGIRFVVPTIEMALRSGNKDPHSPSDARGTAGTAMVKIRKSVRIKALSRADKDDPSYLKNPFERDRRKKSAKYMLYIITSRQYHAKIPSLCNGEKLYVHRCMYIFGPISIFITHYYKIDFFYETLLCYRRIITAPTCENHSLNDGLRTACIFVEHGLL